MAAARIRYSQELREAIAQLGDLASRDAAVREAVAALDDRFAEVRLTPAWVASEEGVEVSEDRATLGLTVLPTRFADPPALTRFLRHELGHVADTLDGTFGYGAVPENLVVTHALRRRFKLLWACSIDGRTARLGGSQLHAREEYEAECERLFPGLSADVVRMTVGQLWEGARPRYCCLLRMAADLVGYPDDTLLLAGEGAAASDRLTDRVRVNPFNPGDCRSENTAMLARKAPQAGYPRATDVCSSCGQKAEGESQRGGW